GLAIVVSLFLVELMNKKRIILNVLCVVAVGTIVLMSGSRGGLLTMGCIVMVWLFNLKGPIRMKILLALIAFVAIVLFCAENGIGPKILYRFSITRLISDGGGGRMPIWKAGIEKFLTSDPLHVIFGYGHGSYTTSVRYVAIGHDDPYIAHNMFINALLEGGLVGLGLIVSCFAALYRYAAKHKNLFGILALTGFIAEGLTLDAQVYRTFAFAVAMAVIWRETTKEKPENVR
ncbi:MAG: O-antigen ligase family protein, partial [Clostridiales bacterium]|nr:O-antigen ligase family protein [Clostridiales bacterium]